MNIELNNAVKSIVDNYRKEVRKNKQIIKYNLGLEPNSITKK